MASLSLNASAYTPSWLQKSAPAGPSGTGVSGPPSSKVAVAGTTANHALHETSAPAKRNVFSVSNTALSTKPIPAPLYASNHTPTTSHLASSVAPPSSPPNLTGGSPSLSKRVPTRMSPAIVPITIRHMNPNADEFVPGNGARTDDAHGTAGLNILPISTADLEAEKRHQGGAQAPAPTAVRTPAGKPAQLRHGANVSPLIAPVSLNLKNEEILAISKSSALKVEAAAYVPRRTMTRVVLSKPSPLVLAADPAKANIEMMLDDVWSLFYLPAWGENIKEENYNPTLVFRIESIPTFWRVFNNVPQPTEMSVGTVYLFRDGIDPKWEDPANRNGGILKMKVSSNRVNEAWELLLCRTIGDSWNPVVRAQINGIALKVRERGYILEIWVTKQTPELTRDLAELWGNLMEGAFATTYYPHEAMQNKAQADKKRQWKKY
ncbi:unnamed protein product [Phytomonas sp. EM1]|nr:unnamed protein product [Phytomonas sp. EM1]|eukprot:CCW61750.1 unnamed protein product [Phytomonas sp. isolate EM1]